MNSRIFPEVKTKVLRIITRLNIGGAASHVINLTAGLDSSSFEQLLVTGTEDPAEGSMLPDAWSRNIQPIIVPEIFNTFSLSRRDMVALTKLYSLMRRERPQIVDTHTARAGFLGRLAARLAGVPVVIHTYHGHVLHGYYGRGKNWLLRCMERSLAKLTDRIIAVSEQVKQELVQYNVAEKEKITVIPLGFDLEPFLSAHVHRREFRKQLALSDDVKLIGIVGRLFPIKNHQLFLTAAAQVAKSDAKARFIIVGDGVLRSALERQARELGLADRVLFTGWQRDLPPIYADLDLLVISSDNEGTPVSAIEAMASGCPVVATRVSGLPDLITAHETGLLVSPQDPAPLAEAIVYLLHNPGTARDIAARASLSARSRFTLKRLLIDTERLYQQLLREKLGGLWAIEQARARS